MTYMSVKFFKRIYYSKTIVMYLRTNKRIMQQFLKWLQWDNRPTFIKLLETICRQYHYQEKYYKKIHFTIIDKINNCERTVDWVMLYDYTEHTI